MKTKITTLILCICSLTISSQLSNELIWASCFLSKDYQELTHQKMVIATHRRTGRIKDEIIKYEYKSNKKVLHCFRISP